MRGIIWAEMLGCLIRIFEYKCEGDDIKLFMSILISVRVRVRELAIIR